MPKRRNNHNGDAKTHIADKGTKAQTFRLIRKPSATNKRTSLPAKTSEGFC